MKRVIGIDPGMTGAIAWISDVSGASVMDMPVVEKEVNPSVLAEYLRTAGDDSWLIVIEKQQAMSKQGVTSTFRTGFNYGMLKAVAMLTGCRVEIIRANIWKKELGLIKKDKDAGRLKAIELFPKMSDLLARKKDHNRADALLIAEYGRRKF